MGLLDWVLVLRPVLPESIALASAESYLGHWRGADETDCKTRLLPGRLASHFYQGDTALPSPARWASPPLLPSHCHFLFQMKYSGEDVAFETSQDCLGPVKAQENRCCASCRSCSW